MARGDDAMLRRHRADRLLAAPDALEEIANVVVAVVEAVKESRLADAEVLPVSPSSQLAAAPAGG